MTTLIGVVVLLAIGVAALLLVLKSKLEPRGGNAPWPFYARKPLSVPEQVMYFRLFKTLPEHIVLAQVALSRLLGVKAGNDFRAWQNRIDRMSADFVVCAKDSTVLAVVELDDASHDKGHRRAADAKKDKALAAAGIRVVRWEVKSLPDEASIRAAFTAQPRLAADAPKASRR